MTSVEAFIVIPRENFTFVSLVVWFDSLGITWTGLLDGLLNSDIMLYTFHDSGGWSHSFSVQSIRSGLYIIE